MVGDKLYLLYIDKDPATLMAKYKGFETKDE